MEIDNGDDLSAEYMYEEVHPRQHAHQQTFAKPHGPPGKKGGRRITRPPGHRDQDDWLGAPKSPYWCPILLPGTTTHDPLHGETYVYVCDDFPFILLFFYF